MAEEHQFWSGLDRTLGTVWSLDDLVSSDSGGKGGELPESVRFPLLAMLAPEAFKAVVDDFKKRKAARASMDPGSVEIGTLSRAEAKALLKSLLPRE